MNSSSPNHIDSTVSNLASIKELPLRDQGLFLLKRLALTFPPGGSFGSTGIVSCFPGNERKLALIHLLGAPWDEIRDAGYIYKESEGVQVIEITAAGWAAIKGNTFDDDGNTTKIVP